VHLLLFGTIGHTVAAALPALPNSSTIQWPYIAVAWKSVFFASLQCKCCSGAYLLPIIVKGAHLLFL
jgi:hypothetical protein